MEPSSKWKFELVMVVLFLGAIIVANLVVTRFGQAALPFTAFFLIPFDLVTRDVLHERWENKSWLWTKMLVLVAAGGLLSYAINAETARIALASCLAFSAMGAINAIGFHLLSHRGRFTRMNVSNVFAAVADSIIFPVVAFGIAGTSLWLSATQAGAKVAGGLLFSFLFIRFIWSKNVRTHQEVPLRGRS